MEHLRNVLWMVAVCLIASACKDSEKPVQHAATKAALHEPQSHLGPGPDLPVTPKPEAKADEGGAKSRPPGVPQREEQTLLAGRNSGGSEPSGTAEPDTKPNGSLAEY